jgi:hypothetical protein
MLNLTTFILWIVLIRMDLGETGWGEWIQLAQDRGLWWAFVNVVMNLQVLVPWNQLDYEYKLYMIEIC